MNVLAIAWKSIRERALVSSLTMLSVALGVALMVTVLVINGIVTQVFNQSSSAYDLVVGAKGSGLQLVLNTIFYMDKPIENVPYKFYLQLTKLRAVEHAIPVALGDSTADGKYRIVGTTAEYFDVEYIPGNAKSPGKRFRYASGSCFTKAFEAVLGAKVAKTYGWKLGDTFKIAHGGNTEDIHADIFTVTGVLAPTGTPADRAVFVHLDGFFQMSGHAKPLAEAEEKSRQAAGEAQDLTKPTAAIKVAEQPSPKPGELSDDEKEVTAILVRIKPGSALAGPMLRGKINDGLTAQAVNPFEQINWLMKNLVGNVRVALLVLTAFILLVSGVGIFVSIYNSLAERRREIAVLRALGASRRTIFSIILGEATLLCLLGGLFGLLLGHALVFIAAPIVEARSDMLVNPFAFEPAELLLLPGLLVIALLVGWGAGTAAYRTDVAKGLQS
jgi:putative ABC transport system permease protein